MTTNQTAENSAFSPPARPEFLARARVVSRPLIEQPRAYRNPAPTESVPLGPPEERSPVQKVSPARLPVAVPHVVGAPHSGFSISSGLAQALPIVSGYLPVAFALGVLCAAAGIPFLATAAMSIIVYAGSAQFVAVSLIGAAAPAWTIILTTFIINFRHFLMSTAIAPKLKHWPRARRILFGGQMTDETFAVLMNHLGDHPDTDPRHVFTVNLAAHTAWIAGTLLGYQASSLIPDLKVIGIDFALPGMFIALVVLQLKDRWLGIAAVSAAVSALTLNRLGAGHVAVLIAAIGGATVAVVLESKFKATTEKIS